MRINPDAAPKPGLACPSLPPDPCAQHVALAVCPRTGQWTLAAPVARTALGEAQHAAMPPRLRGAIFRAMGGATEAIDIDAVVRTACLPMQEATAAALLLHDSQPATGQVAADCTEAAAWLSRLDSTGVPAARAAEWARVRAAVESAAPPPMSTPADRQRFAELVARNAPLLAAARVFAAAVQASWLVDHRKLQPLPSLAEGT